MRRRKVADHEDLRTPTNVSTAWHEHTMSIPQPLSFRYPPLGPPTLIPIIYSTRGIPTFGSLLPTKRHETAQMHNMNLHLETRVCGSKTDPNKAPMQNWHDELAVLSNEIMEARFLPRVVVVTSQALKHLHSNT